MTATVTLTSGDYLAGLPLFALVIAAAGYFARSATRRFTPDLRGLDAVLVGALWFTLAVLLEHVAPLFFGVLSRWTVALASALVAAAAFGCDPGSGLINHNNADAPADKRREPRFVRWIGIGALALCLGGALAYLRHQLGQPLAGTDALNFQIPVLARWIESGSMWQLDQFFPDYSNATYPHHGNILLLAVVLPWKSAYLARYVPLPYAILACAGVYACARELGSDRGWALLGAAVLGAMPVFAKVSVEGAQTDTPMLAFFAIGSLFLLRHARTGARRDLLLAAFGYGLCLGTKWYAVTTLGPLLVVWVIALLVARKPFKQVGIGAVSLGAVVLLVGGVWLLRNWVQAGNPVYPEPLGPFKGPPDPIRKLADWRLTRYTFNGHVWSTYLLPQFNSYFALPGYVMTAFLAVGAAVAAAVKDKRVLVVGLAGLAMFLEYYAMPYSAFGAKDQPYLAFASMRYAMPALMTGAVLLAYVGSKLPFGVRTYAAGFVGLVVIQGIDKQYRPGESLAKIIATTVVVVFGLWVLRRIAPRARQHAWAVAAVLIIGAVGVAFVVRDRANKRATYARFDPTLGWIEAHAPTGHTIGLAGIWSATKVSPVLPAFGPRLGNKVVYAGPFRDHMLRQDKNPASFVARLKASRDDLLIVGRGADPHGPVPEEKWALQAGFRPVIASSRLALLARVR